MKKNLSIILIIIVMLSLLSTSFIFAESEPKIAYNGSLIEFDVKSFNMNGRIMAPARQIAEILGAEIEWNSETQSAWVYTKRYSIEIPIGQKALYIHKDHDMNSNPIKVEMDVETSMKDGRTIVPVRFLVESLGKEPIWDSSIKTVNIKDTDNIKYESVDIKDIESDKSLYSWYEANKRSKGVYFSIEEDFTYILAGAGERPTGGYSVDIKEISREPINDIYILAKVDFPDPDMMVTQAITYPHTLVKIKTEFTKGIHSELIEDNLIKTIKDVIEPISEEDVESMEVFNLEGEKVNEYAKPAFRGIVELFNRSELIDELYILMISGNRLVVTMDNGDLIEFTSYGSETNLLANVITNENTLTYHIKWPEIANILLEKYF